MVQRRRFLDTNIIMVHSSELDLQQRRTPPGDHILKLVASAWTDHAKKTNVEGVRSRNGGGGDYAVDTDREVAGSAA